MNPGFFQVQLDYIYFLYGLAFILVACVCLGLNRQARDLLPWHWLGLFGALHGLSEWATLLSLSFGDIIWLTRSAQGLMAASFICLIEFGRRGMRDLRGRSAGGWIYIPLGLLAAAGSLYKGGAMDVTFRYAFGLTGGLGSAWLLWQASRGLSAGRRPLALAAGGMALYALASGLVVPKAPFFPASWINQEAFFTHGGVPVQIARGLIACGIALAVWLFSQSLLRAKEREQGGPAPTPSFGIWLLPIFLVVLIAGWGMTEFLSELEREDFAQALSVWAQTAARSIDPAILRKLSGNPTDVNLPEYRLLQRQLARAGKTRWHVTGIALLGQSKGKVIFLLDNHLANVESSAIAPAKPGDPYEADPDALSAVLAGRDSVIGPQAAEGGTYYGSYVAIPDPHTKRVLAVLVLETSLGTWQKYVVRNRLGGIGITLLVSLLVLAVSTVYFRSLEAAQRIAASERHYKSLFSNMLGGGAYFKILPGSDSRSADLLCLEVNEMFEQHTGLQKSAVIGRKFSELFPRVSVTSERPGPFPRAALEGQASARFEHFFEPLGRWFSVSAFFPIPGHCAVVFEDISQSKQAEEEVKLQSAIAENMAEGINLVRASDGVMIYSNSKFENMFGYEPGELKGKSVEILNANTGQPGEVAPESVIAALQNTGAWSGELHNRRKDGSSFWGHANISTFHHFLHGKVWVEVHRDITERKQAEESVKLQSAITENMAEGVCLVRASDTVVVYANAKFDDMFGYQTGELTGKPIAVIYGDPDDPKAMQTLPGIFAALRKTGSWRGEVQNRKKGGSLIWCYTTISTFHHSRHGEVWVAVRTDISERKEAEHEMARARDAALESAQVKSEFMTNMSHEIRTPMNAVLGMAALLMESDLSPKQRKFAELIEQSGKSLLHIINDILDFSRMESGQFNVQASDMSLYEAVEHVAEMLAPSAEAKGVALRYSFAPGFPPLLNADAVRIGQVLTNLVGNAVKFTERGEVKIRAEVESQTPSTVHVRVTIQDTGIGISEEGQEKLFRPFSQADASTARKFGGTGLGLAISKKIVELMGGTIGVRSRPGQGSTFWFTVPFGQPASLQPSHPPEPAPVRGLGAADPKSTRILLAEDNPTNQILTYYQLERLGYSVDIVPDGQKALECLRRVPYDLVLMDCQMPELDGYQATAKIRESEGPSKHTPIIAMTAHVLKGEEAKCLAAGMDGYLAKPVTLTALKNVLARWAGYAEAAGTPPAAPAALDAGAAPVDMNILLEATEGNPEAARHLVTTYVSQTASRLKDLERAIQADIPKDVKSISHGLAGSSVCFGAVLLVPAFREMEQLGKEGQLAKATALYMKAVDDFEKVKRFLAASEILESGPVES